LATGVLYIWDATDETRPTLLGQWENPMGVKAGGRDFLGEGVMSTHNLQFENGTIYLAHYGLGVWVLDASTPALWKEPKVLGYYMEEGMDTWDVIVHRGVTYSSGAEGVLSLDFPLTPDALVSRA
jgi:hypothetical protein